MESPYTAWKEARPSQAFAPHQERVEETAESVALFGPITPEYPITLLQEHPDALITATVATAAHPIGEHPEWDLGVGEG
jgi:hypothetical protein